jgi:SPOR domain
MRGIIVASWILAACLTTACSRQESGWQRAEREDTVAAYQQYLEKFPAGTHAVAAREQVLRLQEADAWARAERLRTPESWQRYLADWPEGPHAELAWQALVEFIPPAGPRFEIQLGAWSDAAAARAGREQLLRKHADDLGGLELRIAGPDPGEPALWRLRSGPFDESAARAHCARLVSVQVSCFPVPAPGQSPPFQ